MRPQEKGKKKKKKDEVTLNAWDILQEPTDESMRDGVQSNAPSAELS